MNEVEYGGCRGSRPIDTASEHQDAADRPVAALSGWGVTRAHPCNHQG